VGGEVLTSGGQEAHRASLRSDSRVKPTNTWWACRCLKAAAALKCRAASGSKPVMERPNYSFIMSHPAECSCAIRERFIECVCVPTRPTCTWADQLTSLFDVFLWLYPLADNTAVWFGARGLECLSQLWLCSGNSQSPSGLKAQQRAVHLKNQTTTGFSAPSGGWGLICSAEMPRPAGAFQSRSYQRPWCLCPSIITLSIQLTWTQTRFKTPTITE